VASDRDDAHGHDAGRLGIVHCLFINSLIY
jgi:hypothetical protein